MPKKLAEETRQKNRTLNQWEQFYGSDRLTSFPTHIQFPTGTRCNLRCSFCTERRGPDAVHYNYQDLSFDDFRRIIADPDWQRALASVGTIALYGWGEPLFNRDYEPMADTLLGAYPGIRISISTNGVLFDEGWAEKFVAHDTGDINFSLNAASGETFCRITGSDQFDRVVGNVRALTSLRREWGSSNLSVTLSYVATTENVRELPAFVELAADLQVDSVIVQDIMSLNERTSSLSLANVPELARSIFRMAADTARQRGIRIGFISFETHGEDYFPTTMEMSDQTVLQMQRSRRERSQQESDQPAPPSPYRQATDCFDPWERFMIRADGEVFPCCRAQSFPEFSLGNVFEWGFQEIWNGEGYRGMRSTINTAAPPAVCAVCPRKAGLD